MTVVTQAKLNDENTFCPPLRLSGWDPNFGERPFDLAVWGVFSGTLSVQISYDDGATWLDTGDTFTSPAAGGYTGAVERGFTATPCHIRCGFKSGQYISGTANVRIAQ